MMITSLDQFVFLAKSHCPMFVEMKALDIITKLSKKNVVK